MFNAVGSELILRAVREGLLLVILVSAPPLLASLAVGLIVGILQAATQVHEQTLVFVPKLLAVTLVLIAMGSLLGAQVLRFTQALLLAIPTIH
jgi:flagellar biosynthesis protein FliQ